jgi:hypothetical protein
VNKWKMMGWEEGGMEPGRAGAKPSEEVLENKCVKVEKRQ